MKCWNLIVVFCVILSISIVNGDEGGKYNTVKTKSGPVKGEKQLTTFENKEFYAYKGIPYAKPPVGSLRFKPPQPHEGWKEPLEAFEFGNLCPQKLMFGANTIVVNEDCLYLNIFTPVNAKNLPVMFYIHGGAYLGGSGDDIMGGPDFLLNEDVIMVSINYRLGALGFMSLGTPEYPGNMGLKDMILALKWINENIEAFGGDSKMITIFGVSAGGAATHLLTLTPQTEGLYQRAVAMSGVGFNPWAFSPRNDHSVYMSSFAYENGHAVKDYNELISYLQTVEVIDLINKTTPEVIGPSPGDRLGLDINFAPVVEPIGTKDPVFTKKPEEYVNEEYRQDVDIMYSFANGEGIPFMTSIISDPKILQVFSDMFLFKLPEYDLPFYSFDEPELVAARKKVREYYFKGKAVTENLEKVIDLASDIMFRYGIESAVNGDSNRRGSTYYYSFEGVAKLNIFKTLLNLKDTGINMASHGEDIGYLLYGKIVSKLYEDLDENSIERKMVKGIASTFANFAKNGKPMPSNYDVEWKPVKKDEHNIVAIRNEEYIAKVNVFNEMRQFWDNLIGDYKKASNKARDEL